MWSPSECKIAYDTGRNATLENAVVAIPGRNDVYLSDGSLHPVLLDHFVNGVVDKSIEMTKKMTDEDERLTRKHGRPYGSDGGIEYPKCLRCGTLMQNGVTCPHDHCNR